MANFCKIKGLVVEPISDKMFKIYLEASRLNEFFGNTRYSDILLKKIQKQKDVKTINGWFNDYPFKYAIVQMRE